jgi:patatin-related protein
MADVTELRLALVCYGGVSLAVYMHGVTKELHKLVRASRRFDEVDDLDAPNPFSDNTHAKSDIDSDSEAAYFEALRSMAKAGRRLSVTIDIVSGTSAGGINGVVLAKALARDATQEQLKRLWIDEGDLKTLLRAPAIGGVRTRAVLAAVRQVLALNKPTSPLRGEQLSRLVLAALRDMDDSAAPEATLIPPAGALELYVTATDMHGFEVLVPSGVGGASQRDRYHAQVLEFRGTRNDRTPFGPEGTPALAFSARATSCFPGAFAPVSLKSFVEETGTAVRGRPDLFRFQYEENGLRAEDAWLVDGGVLDNAPFDLVVDAIRQRPAQTEVLRRVVYIQPDPRTPLAPSETGEDTAAPPKREGWLSGLWRTIVGVRGSHPILLELLKLREMNMRIAEVGSIAENQMTEVLTEIRKALDAAGYGIESISSKAQVQSVSDACTNGRRQCSDRHGAPTSDSRWRPRDAGSPTRSPHGSPSRLTPAGRRSCVPRSVPGRGRGPSGATRTPRSWCHSSDRSTCRTGNDG